MQQSLDFPSSSKRLKREIFVKFQQLIVRSSNLLGAAVKGAQSASIPIWDFILLKRFPVAGNPVKVAPGRRHLTRHLLQVVATYHWPGGPPPSRPNS